tara:strand:- start:22 stop:867 length:846 start_codon:yes stop_codon:yes gene_type:complete
MSSFIDHSNFTFYDKDLSNNDDVNDLIALFGYKKLNIDGVYHVSAKARISPSIKNPSRTFACNVDATFNILELCRALNIKKLIYSASSSAYGNTIKLPNMPNDPINCNNPYSITKYIGEELCKTWSKCYGINTISLRYFNVYGARSQLEGQYAPVVGIFFRQLLQEKKPMTIIGTGEQLRDFTYISDVINANLAAMKKCEKHTGRVFNVGYGVNYSINKLAKLISGEFEYIPARAHDAKETLASIKDTIRHLDWEPVVPLEMGIEIMRDYYTKLFTNEEQN